MKKALLAGCSLFLSSLTFAQANPMNPETGFFWIEGKTVNIAYSNAGAPGDISNATVLQVLADIEAKLNGLNVPGLNVSIDTNVRNTSCDGRQRNEVLVCWEAIQGNTGNFVNLGGMEGTTSWREANVIVDKQTAWNEDSLYAMVMHELLHVLGFGHPEGAGNSVLNGAPDLTDIDIAGLQTMYATRCVYVYEEATRNVVLPFATYQNNAYKVTLHHDGGNTFSLASVAMWSAANPPLTPCQSLGVDGNNQVHIPAVNVGGTSVWADLTLQGNVLILTNKGVN